MKYCECEIMTRGDGGNCNTSLFQKTNKQTKTKYSKYVSKYTYNILVKKKHWTLQMVTHFFQYAYAYMLIMYINCIYIYISQM